MGSTKQEIGKEEKDSMVKTLRDLFRRKSACEGQATEILVLIAEVKKYIDTVYFTERPILEELLDFLEKRREALGTQIEPMDQEIAAIKSTLKGTDY